MGWGRYLGSQWESLEASIWLFDTKEQLNLHFLVLKVSLLLNRKISERDFGSNIFGEAAQD